jgi:Trp operon repressor
MTDKQLKRLNRSKLLQMLLEIERENEALRARNELLEQQMKQRELKIAQSGSIAEAALKLSGIFEAAQQAADQYVYNVQRQAAPPKGGTRDA